MDNEWHKIVLVSAAFVAGATIAISAIAFMFYLPDLFK